MSFFTGSIKISELDPIPTLLEGNDFFPLVESSSLTTYRVDLIALNDWFKISGSCLSASYAPFSQAFQESASWASASISASWAPMPTFVQTTQISCSWASQSLNAVSASWASASLSASYASASLSASYASMSLSASYASMSLSASYAPYPVIVADVIPVGTIMAFAGASSVPTNWLECNGEAKLITSFLDLYNMISSTAPTATFGFKCNSSGVANPAGTYFKLPDLRGEFLRGWDNGRGIDSGRVFSSQQNDAYASHTHQATLPLTTQPTTADGNNIHATTGVTSLRNQNYITTAAGSGTETRPRNIAIMYCIKYSTAASPTSGFSLTGDVIGAYTATTVQKIQNVSVDVTVPINGQTLVYDSGASKWVPSIPSSTTKAWACAACTASMGASTTVGETWNNLRVITGSFNISSIERTGGLPPYPVGSATNQYNGSSINMHWIVTLTNALPTTNYCVIGSVGGEQANQYNLTTMFPLAKRTTTKFTMSMAQHSTDFSSPSAIVWFNFMVLHP